MLVENIKLFESGIDSSLLTKLLYEWNKKQAILETNQSYLESRSKQMERQLWISSQELDELSNTTKEQLYNESLEINRLKQYIILLKIANFGSCVISGYL